MRAPLVSIVCTNYNKGSWIADAIDSFLRQEVSFSYEILLIDDKSTDDSPEIIREYAKKYPEIIRTFYNKKNLGITKTWIKVCKKARGKYIARCDGDDYWTDNKKLQKQVDALESNGDSEWCSTDYDVVDENGKVTRYSAVESGFIDLPTTYAEMLATKGFTMSSTWLVSSSLMQSINEELNESAVDDTFNIQLDLFNKTRLTYIPDSAAAYRLSENSDSKPVDEKKAKERDERLRKTQQEYIEKYKDVEYGDIIRILLKDSVHSLERSRLIDRQRSYIRDLEASLIEKDKLVQQKDEQISAIINSKGYKIGRIIVSPISIVRSRLTRRKR